MKRSSPFMRNVDRKSHERNSGQGLILSSSIQRDISLYVQSNKNAFLEKEVKHDDTLQSIALEYNVTVSELKRVNNIHKDNEIHARRIIKVPAKPFSLLVETEDDCCEPGTSKDVLKSSSDNTDNTNIDLFSLPLEVIEENVNEHKSAAELLNFTSNPDYYFKPIKNDAEEIVEDESIGLLPQSSYHPVGEEVINGALSCNGADWDMSWHILVCLALIMAVGGPAYYIWSLWEKKKSD